MSILARRAPPRIVFISLHILLINAVVVCALPLRSQRSQMASWSCWRLSAVASHQQVTVACTLGGRRSLPSLTEVAGPRRHGYTGARMIRWWRAGFVPVPQFLPARDRAAANHTYGRSPTGQWRTIGMIGCSCAAVASGVRALSGVSPRGSMRDCEHREMRVLDPEVHMHAACIDLSEN